MGIGPTILRLVIRPIEMIGQTVMICPTEMVYLIVTIDPTVPQGVIARLGTKDDGLTPTLLPFSKKWPDQTRKRTQIGKSYDAINITAFLT